MENAPSSANKNGAEIEKNDFIITEHDEPMPSTSYQKQTDHDEADEPSKMFKKSFTNLQLKWCRKQPDFIQLKESIQADNK